VTDDNDLRAPDDDTDEPDFAAIYEPHVDGDGWRMTPRMAWYLWSAALYLADEYRTSSPDSFAKILPPVARAYAHDRAWRQQFVAGFEHLTERLGSIEDGSDVLARCTAEELALHLTINIAERPLIDGAFSPAAVCHLPDHGSADEDFDWMRDVLFEDHDVLMLFNPALDGIENDRDANSSLHPRDWFEPFRPAPTDG
jgi:hypothetical protein